MSDTADVVAPEAVARRAIRATTSEAGRRSTTSLSIEALAHDFGRWHLDLDLRGVLGDRRGGVLESSPMVAGDAPRARPKSAR